MTASVLPAERAREARTHTPGSFLNLVQMKEPGALESAAAVSRGQGQGQTLGLL
jgi:hypothetical protein